MFPTLEHGCWCCFCCCLPWHLSNLRLLPPPRFGFAAAAAPRCAGAEALLPGLEALLPPVHTPVVLPDGGVCSDRAVTLFSACDSLRVHLAAAAASHCAGRGSFPSCGCCPPRRGTAEAIAAARRSWQPTGVAPIGLAHLVSSMLLQSQVICSFAVASRQWAAPVAQGRYPKLLPFPP